MNSCIFCGKEPRVTESSNMDGDGWQVVCDECGAMGPMQDTEENAIECWDKRIFKP